MNPEDYFVDFTGLLTLLSSIIDMMPDSLSEKLFQKSIINPKTLIVLANSGSPEIRACVIKVSLRLDPLTARKENPKFFSAYLLCCIFLLTQPIV